MFVSNHSITTNDFEEMCQNTPTNDLYDQLHANNVRFIIYVV